jgi:hypothetical protein
MILLSAPKLSIVNEIKLTRKFNEHSIHRDFFVEYSSLIPKPGPKGRAKGVNSCRAVGSVVVVAL